MTNPRYIAKPFGANDWCVIDTTDAPSAHNYYGMVAFGFDSEQQAAEECTFLNAQHEAQTRGTFYNGGTARLVRR
jgi:hypothetical protein